MRRIHLSFLGAIISCAFLACGSNSSPALGSSSGALTGPVDVRMVPAADLRSSPISLGVKSIVVTIARVEARVDNHDWQTIRSRPVTVDLLNLPSSGFASLGIGQLPAGDESLRLVVDDAGPNYVTMSDGVNHPLIVPSGDESGIKVVGDFDIVACAGGHVTLAFSGDNGIVVHPAGDADTDLDDRSAAVAEGAWVLRPVIRLDEVITSGACTSNGDRDDQGDDHANPHGGDDKGR